MLIKTNFDPQCITFSQMNMIFNARINWRRLTTWTRAYAISRYVGIGDAQELFGRLYVESLNSGDILQIAFGREVSNRYTQYVLQYTIILRELITAHLAGDKEAVSRNVDRAFQNADNTAAFLASINPYWDEAQWRDFFRNYLQLTIEEMNAFVTGNYSQDIETFDRITELNNKMGDAFAHGLYDFITAGSENVNQFPSREGRECFTYDQMNEIYNIRMFWFDLFTWVRAYMLSRYTGIGNTEAIYARLRKVADDYVYMLRQVFGEPYTEELLQELYSYFDLLDLLITAQIENNTEEINRVTRLLYQNADNRAALISSINPYYNQTEWRNRLYNNLRSTIEESNTFLTKDYARNLDIFSTLLTLAESTSDYFAQGIIIYFKQQGSNRTIKNRLCE